MVSSVNIYGTVYSFEWTYYQQQGTDMFYNNHGWKWFVHFSRGLSGKYWNCHGNHYQKAIAINLLYYIVLSWWHDFGQWNQHGHVILTIFVKHGGHCSITLLTVVISPLLIYGTFKKLLIFTYIAVFELLLRGKWALKLTMMWLWYNHKNCLFKYSSMIFQWFNMSNKLSSLANTKQHCACMQLSQHLSQSL